MSANQSQAHADPKTVLIPIPHSDFDPTEVAVSWKILSHAGVRVLFASPDGQTGAADPIMVTGVRLGILKPFLRADRNGRDAYQAMLLSREFKEPLRYTDLTQDQVDGVILPGGHGKGMRPYLESEVLQGFVAEFFESGKPLGAICHGVVLAARSISTRTGKSILHGLKTTALPEWMELTAWNLTRLWLGDYYRTYPITVEDEVTSVLASREDFIVGPRSMSRDSSQNRALGFVVEDQNYLSARWPGDAHRFATEFLRKLGETPSSRP